MLTVNQEQLSEVLERLAQELDISPSDYKRAVESYNAVGNWLKDGYERAYPGSTAEPEVYPQGSMRLGTVVRPLKNGKEADFDVDLVCELQGNKDALAASDVKTQVGDQLKAEATYAKMLDKEGRRCWKLQYAHKDGIGFHMDILPCVPEEDGGQRLLGSAGVSWQYAQYAIAITDKDEDRSPEYKWDPSNPKGYAGWFEDRNRAPFVSDVARQKELLYERNRSIYASVEQVPDQLVRTPLQRAIQILKRHRDIRFKDDPENKPISIIITTLAAHLYQNETNICVALDNIVAGLAAYAELMENQHAELDLRVRDLGVITRQQDGTWYIPNPVNPAENFADRWHKDDHAKARAFFRWVGRLREDIIGGPLGEADLPGAEHLMKRAMGLASPTVVVPRRAAKEELRDYSQVKIVNPSKPWGR